MNRTARVGAVTVSVPAGCALSTALVHVEMWQSSDGSHHVNWFVENSYCCCAESWAFGLSDMERKVG